MNYSLQSYFLHLNQKSKLTNWIWEIVSYYNDPIKKKSIYLDSRIVNTINKSDSTIDGIAKIYKEYLPQQMKLLFRESLGDALRNHINDESVPVESIEELIYIIAKLRANESVSVLQPLACGSYFGNFYPQILFECLAALKYLAPTKEAYSIATGIINSQYFNENYLFEALKILIECYPHKTAKLILYYELRLSQLYNNSMVSREEQEKIHEIGLNWAEFINIYSGRNWLIEFWKYSSHENRVMWIFDLFFYNQELSDSAKIKAFSDNEITISYGDKLYSIKNEEKYSWTMDRLINRELIIKNQNILDPTVLKKYGFSPVLIESSRETTFNLLYTDPKKPWSNYASSGNRRSIYGY